MKSHTNQKGTAIIVALFVTALVAIAAITLMEYLRIDIRRTQLISQDLQANQLAQGSVDWAIDQLTLNLKQKQTGKLIDKLPMRSDVKEFNGMKIYSTIYDAQSRFNINTLSNPAMQEMFLRLVHIVSPKTTPAAIKALTNAILDWITPGIVNSPYDVFYTKLNPPYRSAHRLMTSISELRFVKGMTTDLYNALSPTVTALPEQTNVNINTANPSVIMSLSPSMSRETALTIRRLLATQPAISMENLANLSVVKNNSIQQNNITVSSTFFLVITHVFNKDQDTQIYTLLKRVVLKDSEPAVLIVWQSRGTV